MARPKNGVTFKDRLHAKTIINVETFCWEWTGLVTRKGYGQIKKNGKNCTAHRLAWEERNGPIPCGLSVLHHCDNRSCVNVEHLFLGTQADNVRDMVCKGRQRAPKGEDVATAKLAPRDVSWIRLRYANGERQRDLAKSYGVGKSLISYIVRRDIWKSVA